MTNTKILRALIEERGLKYKYIAKELNITPFSLQQKIDGIRDFKGKEILKICEILAIKDNFKLKEDIFFAK